MKHDFSDAAYQDALLDLFNPGSGLRPPVLAGREPQQRALAGLLRRVKKGTPPSEAVLYGPRGNGKTVLLRQFEDDCRAAGVGVIALNSSQVPTAGKLGKQLLGPETGVLRAGKDEAITANKENKKNTVRSENVQSGAKHKTMPYRCREKECAKRFSVKTGTVMQNSNLDYQVWAIAIYLMVTNIKGVSSMKLHRDLSITQKSAWHLAHRLRTSWEANSAQFAGPVEVDETYIGGKEGNKHASKKANAGRGTVGKAALVGGKDRETNQVVAGSVKRTDKETLHGFVQAISDEGAQVYTDDATAYRGLPRAHESVKHSVNEFVKGQAHTNGIESFWALLKRGYHGIYHHMSENHLDRYVGEFAGRHNIRGQDTVNQIASISRGMEQKRLRYQDLIA